MAPRIAQSVHLDRQARKVYVDGEEFPWHTSGDYPLTIEVEGQGPSFVTLTLPVSGEVKVTPRD